MITIDSPHARHILDDVQADELIEAVIHRIERLKYEGREKYADRIEALETVLESLTGKR
jgi:hypothetical protein